MKIYVVGHFNNFAIGKKLYSGEIYSANTSRVKYSRGRQSPSTLQMLFSVCIEWIRSIFKRRKSLADPRGFVIVALNVPIMREEITGTVEIARAGGGPILHFESFSVANSPRPVFALELCPFRAQKDQRIKRVTRVAVSINFTIIRG